VLLEKLEAVGDRLDKLEEGLKEQKQDNTELKDAFMENKTKVATQMEKIATLVDEHLGKHRINWSTFLSPLLVAIILLIFQLLPFIFGGKP
jgi:uncharacterized coiled-coil protein SlyX